MAQISWQKTGGSWPSASTPVGGGTSLAFTEQLASVAGQTMLCVGIGTDSPVAITPPASWGAAIIRQRTQGSLTLTLIRAATLGAAGGNGTVHTFTFASCHAGGQMFQGVCNTTVPPVVCPFTDAEATVAEGNTGAGGDSTPTLLSETITPNAFDTVDSEGVFIVSLRAVLFAPPTTIVDAAPVGNGLVSQNNIFLFTGITMGFGGCCLHLGTASIPDTTGDRGWHLSAATAYDTETLGLVIAGANIAQSTGSRFKGRSYYSPYKRPPPNVLERAEL